MMVAITKMMAMVMIMDKIKSNENAVYQVEDGWQIVMLHPVSLSSMPRFYPY